jgi:hypothetical protein
MFTKRGIITGVGALLLTATAIAVTAGTSSALPPRNGCAPDCATPPPTTVPPPSVTTISQITPSFGWSGDAMSLKGYHFTNATVTVQGQSATVTGRSDTQINFLVPTITSNVVGPVSVPVVVSSAFGSASTSFMLSPSMTISGGQTFGVNAQFGQGMDGSAGASATVDRASGFVVANETVVNTQFWLSLTVVVSAVWLDVNGNVVGFTAPHPVTSTGVFFHWPTGDTTARDTWTTVMGPNAGVGPLVHSGVILMTRDHQAEMLSTLTTAWATGMAIKDVVAFLAPFFI